MRRFAGKPPPRRGFQQRADERIRTADPFITRQPYACTQFWLCAVVRERSFRTLSVLNSVSIPYFEPMVASRPLLAHAPGGSELQPVPQQALRRRDVRPVAQTTLSGKGRLAIVPTPRRPRLDARRRVASTRTPERLRRRPPKRRSEAGRAALVVPNRRVSVWFCDSIVRQNRCITPLLCGSALQFRRDGACRAH
jgi:hypothetical protein